MPFLEMLLIMLKLISCIGLSRRLNCCFVCFFIKNKFKIKNSYFLSIFKNI